MTLTTTKTARDFALNLPGVRWVFEKLGIDCCRGGVEELREGRESACAKGKVVRLEQASTDTTLPDDERDWSRAPLSDLITHIVTKHHKFTRDELPRLIQLHIKVCSVHSTNHPELVRLHSILHELQQELVKHMLKEEQILFPCIEQLEKAANRGEHAPTPFPCGTIRNPIESLKQEHDDAEQALRRLRECSSNYAVPADAGLDFRTLYKGLEYFEKDLHQHIRLENNILLPRAAELEATV